MTLHSSPASGQADLQLAEYNIPVLTPCLLVLHDPPSGQIEHPPQEIAIRETRFVLSDLSELPVQTLDDIGRVYDLPDFRRIFKKYSKPPSF